jgi:polar amino acid transport system substrate-binding protein
MKILKAAAVALVLVLAGCTATPKVSAGTGSATAPQPQGVRDPAVIPSAATGSTSCSNPTQSYSPLSPMPAPGQMPAGSTMAAIQAQGVLRIGVDQDTYLFGYRDPSSGDIVGFDIDILHAIAKAIFGDPDKLQYVVVTTADRIPDLKAKTVDIVADTMTINCSRWQDVAFSTDYYNAGQTVLVPSTSKVNSIDALGGQKVCAADGSTSIANIAARSSHPIPVSVVDWTDCLVMLQQNQVAAISTDDTILRGLEAQDPDTRLVTAAPFTSEPYGLAMNRDQTGLVRFVNGVLDQMRQDGQWAAIYTKWLGGTATPPAPVYGRE